MIDRWSGEPAIKITSDGAKMLFLGGQSIMDQSGFENAAQISLFTKNNFWGNTLLPVANQIGSDFEQIRTIVDKQTINDIQDAAQRALQWMIDTGIAQRIEISVTNPVGDQIRTEIKIYPPGQDVQHILLTKNGISWLLQAQNPTHEKMREVN